MTYTDQEVTRMALDHTDLQAALDDERHLGFGYMTRDYLDETTRGQLDALVLSTANELNLTADEFFHWLNSKPARWLVDHTSGQTPSAALVRQYLNAEQVAEVVEA